MEEYNQKNADSSYAKFVYGKELTEKLRKNATEKIAPGVQKEEIIGVFDTSITGSAKSGLVITLGQVCSKKLKNGPIELDGLRFVSQVDGTPDRICFLYENGLLRDTTVSENSELRKMRQFFERLCPYTAAIEPPKKEWEELHHKKGRILRKKIEEAALLSEMSAENLYLRGSMDEVLLEKFCQCCHGAVEESEIIFTMA